MWNIQFFKNKEVFCEKGNLDFEIMVNCLYRLLCTMKYFLSEEMDRRSLQTTKGVFASFFVEYFPFDEKSHSEGFDRGMFKGKLAGKFYKVYKSLDDMWCRIENESVPFYRDKHGGIVSEEEFKRFVNKNMKALKVLI